MINVTQEKIADSRPTASAEERRTMMLLSKAFTNSVTTASSRGVARAVARSSARMSSSSNNNNEVMRCVMLNAARLDYDERIDLDKLKASVGGQLTRYEISNTPQEVLERVEGHAVVVNKEMPLGGDLIRAFPPCVKLICEAGTGYNNIDLVAARDMNIQVANVPTYATDAMSHMAITFVMALSCSLVPQAQSLATGDRSYLTNCHLGSLPHFELTHKTIGLIGGLGTIGKRVTSICHALGMNVLVTSTSHPLGPIRSSNDSEHTDQAETTVVVVSMDELMARSDFVSIHCPLNDSTKHLVDASAISKMKPTSFLINTARGSIIDQTALIQALQNKTIAGAALDVFGEGSAPPPALPEDSPFYGLDNVILTPHIGWQRMESRQRVVDTCAENIVSFARGEPTNIDMETGRPRR